MRNRLALTAGLFFFIIGILIKPIIAWLNSFFENDISFLASQSRNFIIVGLAFLFIFVIRKLKRRFLKRFDVTEDDNLRARKVHTQVAILEKILIFVTFLVATGLILISFESIRDIGIGLFASAGVAGIIIGLSAQKMVGALLAGIQIAITQPFRLGDAVVVEGEWGWIEEINLTYVVVRIWDKRRLVLPSSYFLEKPFQNWTKNSSDIIGTVFLYTDYSIPFEELRSELTRVLESTDLWDGKVNVLQVTDSKEFSVESRILVSAINSPTAWDLRVLVREKMITFIQANYPDSFSRTRIELNEKDSKKDDGSQADQNQNFKN
ncbi:Small-conductance mechanosensitive channel [Nonlabens sp. Hel1_33_55]|uniref:mechanosensitive ion channel family protein n=1 Tax=Nonlabens sp. Hel1_33_55 TaxID=1336802 RepID=UPI000875E79F|nr:mechanosensitive ion channel domain-containing protein [Nonlabens sp. Hel1_33_55]SCY29825.1 Small-conductance mechanosensitive channel [Nonlabens sp. Hel1_33_55]